MIWSLLCLMLMSPTGLVILLSAALALLIILGVPLTMIIMGSVHHHDCPAQPFIPIFLILSGIKSSKVLKVLY